MTAGLRPLTNLRTSLQRYLEKPEKSNRELYRHAMAAILQMHDTIADFMLSGKDDSVLRRYMRTFQEQMRLLFDDIPYSWIENTNLNEEAPNSNNTSKQKYNICYECFRLIREMQLAYPNFFDNSCAPPLLYLMLEKSRHYQNWTLTSKWFNKKREKYNRIWQIIDSYLEDLWDVNHRFSYSEIAYGFNFIDQLTHNIQAKGPTFSTKALYSFLIYMNFNDIGFLIHFTTELRAEMDTLSDFEKIALLEELQLEVKCAPVRKDYQLDPGNPPISEMLSNWVKKELKNLQS